MSKKFIFSVAIALTLVIGVYSTLVLYRSPAPSPTSNTSTTIPVINEPSSNSSVNQTVYYAKAVRYVDTGPRIFPVWSIFKYDLATSKKEVIATDIGGSDNLLWANDFRYVLGGKAVLMSGSRKVELFNVATRQRSIVYQSDLNTTTTKTYEGDTLVCEPNITSAVANSDGTQILISTEYLQENTAATCGGTRNGLTMFEWQGMSFRRVKDFTPAYFYSGNEFKASISRNDSPFIIADYQSQKMGGSPFFIVWDPSSGKEALSIKGIFSYVLSASYTNVAFTRTDNFEGKGCEDFFTFPGKTIELLNLLTLQTSTIFSAQDPLTRFVPIAFSADGKSVLVTKHQYTLDNNCISPLYFYYPNTSQYFTIHLDTGSIEPVLNLFAWANSAGVLVKETRESKNVNPLETVLLINGQLIDVASSSNIVAF